MLSRYVVQTRFQGSRSIVDHFMGIFRERESKQVWSPKFLWLICWMVKTYMCPRWYPPPSNLRKISTRPRLSFFTMFYLVFTKPVKITQTWRQIWRIILYACFIECTYIPIVRSWECPYVFSKHSLPLNNPIAAGKFVENVKNVCGKKLRSCLARNMHKFNDDYEGILIDS